MSSSLVRRCLSEVAGTALLVGIGTGAIVAGANAGGVPQWVLAIAWFGAVALPVELFAFRSAHINPVVTLALVAAGRFPAREAPYYVLAQTVGAVAGSFTVLVTLGGAAHLGATIPQNGTAFPSVPLEFAFTFLLVLAVLYLTSPDKEPSHLMLLLPALVVGISTLLIGPISGSSLNPARTLAPALFSGEFAGIWIYFLAPPLAALAAVLMVRWVVRPADLSSMANPGT